MGDNIDAARDVTLTAKVLHGDPGLQLIVVHDGLPVRAAPVAAGGEFVLRVPATPGRWRLQVQRGTTIVTVSTPIWVSEPATMEAPRVLSRRCEPSPPDAGAPRERPRLRVSARAGLPGPLHHRRRRRPRVPRPRAAPSPHFGHRSCSLPRHDGHRPPAPHPRRHPAARPAPDAPGRGPQRRRKAPGDGDPHREPAPRIRGPGPLIRASRRRAGASRCRPGSRGRAAGRRGGSRAAPRSGRRGGRGW